MATTVAFLLLDEDNSGYIRPDGFRNFVFLLLKEYDLELQVVCRILPYIEQIFESTEKSIHMK